MTGRRDAGTRLAVDPIACTGHGLCAAWLPERIALDEWGYPIVSGEAVGEDLLGDARRAAAQCPVRALRLTRLPSRGG
jgi:ferredoxin